MFKTGYRCGAIGDYTGGDSADAAIAWKALNYEYEELDNQSTLEDLAAFLKMPIDVPDSETSWDDPKKQEAREKCWQKVLAEFRKRYGDIHGIWLSRNKKESRLYQEYGDPEPVEYDPKLQIIDLGGDGIYVLQGEAPRDPNSADNLCFRTGTEEIGYRNDAGEWVWFKDEKGKTITRYQYEQLKKKKTKKATSSLGGIR